MDRLEFYRETIENVLKKHADIPYSYGEIDEYLIVDRDRLTQLDVQLAHILFFPQVP